jgi:hypothetical protein
MSIVSEMYGKQLLYNKSVTALTMPWMYSNLLPNQVLHTTSSAPTTPAICRSSSDKLSIQYITLCYVFDSTKQ